MRRFFGGFVPWVLDDVPWDRVVSGEFLSDYRGSPTVDIQATPSFRYWPRTSGPMTYAKPALWLHTLERALGWTTVQQILVDVLRAVEVQAPEARAICFRWPTK